MLAIHNYLTLAVFEISLNNCHHLWWFRFSLFDHGRAVRIVTIANACAYRDAVVHPTNTDSQAGNFF